jgi:hypothetical protein
MGAWDRWWGASQYVPHGAAPRAPQAMQQNIRPKESQSLSTRRFGTYGGLVRHALCQTMGARMGVLLGQRMPTEVIHHT